MSEFRGFGFILNLLVQGTIQNHTQTAVKAKQFFEPQHQSDTGYTGDNLLRKKYILTLLC